MAIGSPPAGWSGWTLVKGSEHADYRAKEPQQNEKEPVTNLKKQKNHMNVQYETEQRCQDDSLQETTLKPV